MQKLVGALLTLALVLFVCGLGLGQIALGALMGWLLGSTSGAGLLGLVAGVLVWVGEVALLNRLIPGFAGKVQDVLGVFVEGATFSLFSILYVPVWIAQLLVIFYLVRDWLAPHSAPEVILLGISSVFAAVVLGRIELAILDHLLPGVADQIETDFYDS